MIRNKRPRTLYPRLDWSRTFLVSLRQDRRTLCIPRFNAAMTNRVLGCQSLARAKDAAIGLTTQKIGTNSPCMTDQSTQSPPALASPHGGTVRVRRARGVRRQRVGGPSKFK